MREIKFRAWDVISKHWIIVILKRNANFFPEFPKNSINSRNLTEWMQFTGLKDKNGKEIYEGDIISYFRERTCADHGNFKGKLKQATVHIDSLMGTYPFYEESSDFIPYDECEVIGNIYENPELLK